VAGFLLSHACTWRANGPQGVQQRTEIGECIDGHQRCTERESGTCDRICHPNRNRAHRSVGQLTMEVLTSWKRNPALALKGNSVESEPTVMHRYALGNIGIM
jgi:hypothetical protein